MPATTTLAGDVPRKNNISGIGPAIIYTVWVNVVVATIMVALRAYAASRRDNKWRWDFIWIVLSLVTGVLGGILLTKAVTEGLGSHEGNLTVPELFLVLKWGYFAVYAGTASIAFSKFSVISLLLDVHRGTQRSLQIRIGRVLLWGCAVLFTITTLLELFLTAFQCHPLSKLWDFVEPGSCPIQGPARSISYVHAMVGGLTDIFLALYPVSLIWNLQTSRRTKVGFCILMGVGIVPGAASFVRYRLLHRMYAAMDFTYSEGLFMVWAVVEVGTLIILGSIPPLRPLFLRVVYGVKTLTSRGGTHNGYTNTSTVQMRSNVQPFSTTSSNRDKLLPLGPRAMVRELDNTDRQRILVSHSYQVDARGPLSKNSSRF